MFGVRRVVQAFLSVAFVNAVSGSDVAQRASITGPSLTVPQLRGEISSGLNEMLSFYNHTSGWFGPSNKIPFWTTANAIEMLANLLELEPSLEPTLLPIIERTFITSPRYYCTDSCFHDDLLWYSLAWARVGEVTGNATYTATAAAIHTNLTGPWHAWNSTCGGIEWNATGSYLNAITNELFISASVKLYDLTSNATFLQWAQRDWAWFNATGMLTARPFLIQDGLKRESCHDASGAYWTYNQGVFLSGLARLGAITNTPALAGFAAQIALASADYFTAGGPAGVLRETSCSAAGDCGGGQDGRQFKGAFIRHLSYALPAMAAASPDPSAVRARLEALILNSTASLLASGSRSPGRSGGDSTSYSQLWTGPWQSNDCCPYVSQGAGLDLVVAALAVLQRRERFGNALST